MKLITAAPSTRQVDTGLALLRLITGAVFIAHGAQKLFVYGFDGVAGGFAQMGVPFPGIMGPLVGGIEFFGGLALVTGLLTRIAGVGLTAVMLGAMAFVHLPNGFFLPNGYEFVLSLAGAALTLAITGAGRFSLDAVLSGRQAVIPRHRPETLRRAA